MIVQGVREVLYQGDHAFTRGTSYHYNVLVRESTDTGTVCPVICQAVWDAYKSQVDLY